MQIITISAIIFIISLNTQMFFSDFMSAEYDIVIMCKSTINAWITYPPIICRYCDVQPSIELLELFGVVRENGNEQTSFPPVVRSFCVSTLKTYCHSLINTHHKWRLNHRILWKTDWCFTFDTQHTPLSYDYVLVAKTVDNLDRQASKKQTEYIEELKKKNMKVTVSVKSDRCRLNVSLYIWF